MRFTCALSDAEWAAFKAAQLESELRLADFYRKRLMRGIKV